MRATQRNVRLFSRLLPWERVPAWLAEAALVIVPSHAETFGLVALEAMAGGTPVVAYDIDNLPELIGTPHSTGNSARHGAGDSGQVFSSSVLRVLPGCGEPPWTWSPTR